LLFLTFELYLGFPTFHIAHPIPHLYIFFIIDQIERIHFPTILFILTWVSTLTGIIVSIKLAIIDSRVSVVNSKVSVVDSRMSVVDSRMSFDCLERKLVL